LVVIYVDKILAFPVTSQMTQGSYDIHSKTSAVEK